MKACKKTWGNTEVRASNGSRRQEGRYRIDWVIDDRGRVRGVNHISSSMHNGKECTALTENEGVHPSLFY